MLSEIRTGGWVLMDKDGKPVLTGIEYTSFRGDKYQIAGGAPPHKPSSTGKVWAYEKGSRLTDFRELYPTVFNMRWVVDNSLGIKEMEGKHKLGTPRDNPESKQIVFYIVS